MAERGSDCKTGAEHLALLCDGRSVYIDGTLVADVTTDPAFRNSVASAAALYDFQSRPENLERMTFRPEGGGRRINRCWQLPRDYPELVARREALTLWAGQSGGFVGRSPDHVASSLVGQVIGIDVFRRHGEARAKALLDYFDYVSRNDLFLSYVIINPQGDRRESLGRAGRRLGGADRRRGQPRHHRARRQDARHQRDHGKRDAGRQSAAAAPGRGGARGLLRGAAGGQGAQDPVAQILRGGGGVGFRQPDLEPLRLTTHQFELFPRVVAVGDKTGSFEQCISARG